MSAPCYPYSARRESALVTSWKRQAHRLHREAFVFYFALRHPRMPWYARLVAACTVGYLFSPIQFIPSFIPVIGFSDDLLVLFLSVKLLQRITPSDVLTECRELADAAQRQRKEEVRTKATLAAAVLVSAFWLFAAVVGTRALMSLVLH